MKKFLVLSILLSSTLAFAQTGTQTMSRIRDATNPANVANVNRPNADNVNPAGVYAVDEIGLEYCFDGASWDRMRCMSSGDAIAGATQGLLVTGMTHFFNGATFQRWRGAALADATANPTVPYTGSFLLYWDAVGGHWDRVLTHTAGDALSATPQGIDSLNYTLFYDGANYRRWLGAATGDAVVATTVAPWTNGFNYWLHGASWDRMLGTTSADNLSATPDGLNVLGFTHWYDGTNFRRWTGAASADAVANPTVPYVENFNMSWDVANSHWDRLTSHAAGDALSATQQGIDSLSHTLFYDGSNYRRWLGAATGDAVAATTVAPWTNGFNYWYHGTTWDRMVGLTSADNLSATPDGLSTLAFTHWYDGTNFRRWTGAALTDATANPTIPYTGSFGFAWDSTNSHWDRVRGDTAGNLTVNQSTTFPGYGRIQDGDSDVLADVLDSFADGLATTLNGVMTGSVIYLDNGATLNKAKADATGGMLVGVDNWPGAFDEANARLNGYKVGSKPYTPPKETNASIGTAVEVVLASKEIVGYPNCTITLRNTDAADPFVSVDAYVNPDNAGTCGDVNWISLSWATCDILPATQTCQLSLTGNSDRYVCVTVGAADANTVSVDAWLTCNPN